LVGLWQVPHLLDRFVQQLAHSNTIPHRSPTAHRAPASYAVVKVKPRGAIATLTPLAAVARCPRRLRGNASPLPHQGKGTSMRRPLHTASAIPQHHRATPLKEVQPTETLGLGAENVEQAAQQIQF
jgi:hypothetical protein